jgi:glucosamine--fructose-6-phosphate aminotransferase (isomerizing)
MCGIVGYVGPNVDDKALQVVMEGLARLEYRGYDSAGVALVDGDHVVTAKRAGKLANLVAALEQESLPGSSAGIGHTRWATHGGPTDQNAHPHCGGEDGKLASTRWVAVPLLCTVSQRCRKSAPARAVPTPGKRQAQGTG